MVRLEKRGFYVVNHRQAILLVIPPIFLAFATGVMIVRWRARQRKRINTLLEDILCLCGLILNLLVVSIIFILVLVDGQGLSTQDVEAHFGERLGATYWYRSQLALDCCWAISVAAVQLSLLQFYTRTYNAYPTFVYSTYVIMGMIVAWCTYAIIAWTINCHPPGSCTLVSKSNCITIGSLHVVFTALAMALAVPGIPRMESTGLKRRLSVLGPFILGSFCIICAVMRIDCAIPFFSKAQLDLIPAAWGRVLFSPLEIAVGIIACSIPTLTHRVERHHIPEECPIQRLRRLKARTGSSGSSTINLNPANWVGKNAGCNNAFVSLEEGTNSNRSVSNSRGDDIKVVKEVTVVQVK